MKIFISFLLAIVFLQLSFLLPTVALANTQDASPSGQVLGIHVLNPYELEDAVGLLQPNQGEEVYKYLTIPFSLTDLSKLDSWQDFFDQAKEHKVIPVVRLVTQFEDGAWKAPSRFDVVRLIQGLNSLSWPNSQKIIIVFNEPNHAHEWGGSIDPKGYAQILEFSSLWAKTTDDNFVVLPAAVDLAASNTARSMEGFQFWNMALAEDEKLFKYIDFWNSHSYPNPGFQASAYADSKRSLTGFEYELDFVKQKTGRDLKVFITETGWKTNTWLDFRLDEYYTFAAANVWSDPRIVAVTPFLLRGAPGPFADFSFIDEFGKPTRQYFAYKEQINKNGSK